VGIALPDESGTLALCFRDAVTGFRRIAPSRLPACESAFAMTVHKSQGSEFDRVLAVLPVKPSVVATRELLYTAVTRARSSLTLACSPETLGVAIDTRQWRDSGLSELLVG